MAKWVTVEQLDQMVMDLADTARHSHSMEIRTVADRMILLIRPLRSDLAYYRKLAR